MNNASIKRVGYELSIFDRLKRLISIGFNVRQISETEHDSQLLSPPMSPDTSALEKLLKEVQHHQTTDGIQQFSVGGLKPNSKRMTLVFDSPESASTKLITNLQKLLTEDCEFYLASSLFRFGVFIRSSEIYIWEAE